MQLRWIMTGLAGLVGCFAVDHVDAQVALTHREFEQRVQQQSWNEAAYCARRFPYVSGGYLASRWKELRHDGAESSKQERFELLQLYWQYCLSHQPGQTFEVMSSDYLQLADELDVPPASMTATEATLSLFRRNDPRAISRLDAERTEELFEQCLQVLAVRPDDGAVHKIVQQLCTKYFNPGTRTARLEYSALREVCVTPKSKILLVRALIRANTVPDETLKSCVIAALPHMDCDQERSEVVHQLARRLVDVEDSHAVIRYCKAFIKRYPSTPLAKSELLRLVSETTRVEGADAALATPEAFRTPVLLGPEQVRQYQLSVVRTLIDLRQYREAEALLSDARLRWPDNASQQRIWEVAIDLYRSSGDKEKFAETAPKFRELFVDDEVLMGTTAPAVARFYVNQGQHQIAIDAWKLWAASSGGCGSWRVLPEEMKEYRIATCYLHLNQPNAAIKRIVDGMIATSRAGPPNNVLPHLLFYIYDGAGQIDDLPLIARELEAAGRRLKSMPTFVAWPHSRRVLPIELPEEHDWGVRQLLSVRNTAGAGELETLVGICSLADDKGFAASNSLMETYRMEPSVSSAIWWEAAVGAGRSGEQAFDRIAAAYEEADQQSAREWLLISLLECDQPRAIQWLEELSRHGRDQLRAAAERDLQIAKNYPHQFERMKFSWPAPRQGSLPRSLAPMIRSSLAR